SSRAFGTLFAFLFLALADEFWLGRAGFGALWSNNQFLHLANRRDDQFAILQALHARWKVQVLDVQDRVLLHLTDVVANNFRDLKHQAFDLKLGDDLLEHGSFGFALGRALEFQRHRNLDLFIETDAREINVNQIVA